MDWIKVFPLVRTVWNWWRSRMGLNRDHDLAIFKKLDAIANEPNIDEILNDRIFTSNLRLNDAHVIDDLIVALRRNENQYIDATIQLRAGELAHEMGALMSFVAKKFLSVPGQLLAFRPDPIDEDVYSAEWKELNEKLKKAWEAYKTYRQAVKDRLMI
jgi:hypothetical protein